MQKDEKEKLTFSRREAAQFLGVSVVTIDRELARHNIPHFRSGRRVLFTRAHLNQYIKRNECKAK